jgi:sugar transferase (PEP-CTERM/EpsH1 system associated)
VEATRSVGLIRASVPAGSTRALRILMLTPHFPYPPTGGAPMRNYQFLRELSRRHRVSLLAYSEPAAVEDGRTLRRMCETVETVGVAGLRGARKRVRQLRSLISASSYLRSVYASPEMQRAIDGLLRAQDFDLIQAESSLMANFAFRSSAALVLDEHNIEYELLQRTSEMERSLVRKIYNRAECAKFQRQEVSAWRRVDGCVVTSEREAAIVRAQAPGTRTAVVGNGVDLEYFQPSGVAPDPSSIVFTGRLDYRPNTDAVVHFARAILPNVLRRRPGAVFTVVGTAPPDEVKRLAGPHVVITGSVSDVRPFLTRAAVAIAPMRIGGGTRLKILEAMATGKAVVSTALGCEGLDVRDRHDVLIAGSDDAFAQSVVEVLGDPSLARVLGARARARVEAAYGWPALASRLEAFHATVVK